MASTSTSFVVILGIATVFVGLIGLVILCKILGILCNLSNVKDNAKNSVSTKSEAAVKENNVIENRQEIIAAVSAAIAEDLGADISAIRIISFKKI